MGKKGKNAWRKVWTVDRRKGSSNQTTPDEVKKYLLENEKLGLQLSPWNGTIGEPSILRLRKNFLLKNYGRLR